MTSAEDSAFIHVLFSCVICISAVSKSVWYWRLSLENDHWCESHRRRKSQQIFGLFTRVANNINGASILFKCPSSSHNSELDTRALKIEQFNGTQPPVIRLFTAVLFLLWHFKTSAVKKDSCSTALHKLYKTASNHGNNPRFTPVIPNQAYVYTQSMWKA